MRRPKATDNQKSQSASEKAKNKKDGASSSGPEKEKSGQKDDQLKILHSIDWYNYWHDHFSWSNSKAPPPNIELFMQM